MLYQPKKTIVILVYACRLNLHFLTDQQDPNDNMTYKTILNLLWLLDWFYSRTDMAFRLSRYSADNMKTDLPVVGNNAIIVALLPRLPHLSSFDLYLDIGDVWNDLLEVKFARQPMDPQIGSFDLLWPLINRCWDKTDLIIALHWSNGVRCFLCGCLSGGLFFNDCFALGIFRNLDIKIETNTVFIIFVRVFSRNLAIYGTRKRIWNVKLLWNANHIKLMVFYGKPYHRSFYQSSKK